MFDQPASLRSSKAGPESGFGKIMNGECGRSYDGVRFMEQTEIASEGWSGAKSDAVYFIGDDTVTEGLACPEEIHLRHQTQRRYFHSCPHQGHRDVQIIPLR